MVIKGLTDGISRGLNSEAIVSVL